MAKPAGRFVKKDSVARYARRYGNDAAKKRFGDSTYSQGMRRGRTPGTTGSSGGSGTRGKFIKWLIILLVFTTVGILVYSWKGMLSLIIFFGLVLSIWLIIKVPSMRKFLVGLLIILALIAVFVIFIYNSGYWDENIVPKWDDAKSSGGGFFSFFTNLFNPENIEDIGGFEDKELKKEGIGVYVNSFKGDPTNSFKEDGKITVKAEIDIGSLSEQSSEVNFMCRLQGYGNEDNKADEVIPEEGIVLPAYPDKLPRQTIFCFFDNGVTSLGRKDSREVELTSSFENFYSRSDIGVYLITQENKNDLGDKDSFTEYDWDSSLTKKDDNGRIVESKYSPGPVKIPITINYPQPFILRETFNPFLKVNIVTDQRVNLVRVNDFRLYVPEEYIELIDNSACTLDLENSYSDGDYKVYGLKDEIYSKLDEECENKECYDEKRNIDAGCYFDVKAFDQGPVRSMIKAEIWYDFEHVSKTSVNIEDS